MLDLNSNFFLKKGVKIINGYHNAALYDMNSSKIYLVSKYNGNKLSKIQTQEDIDIGLQEKMKRVGLVANSYATAEMLPNQFEYDSFDDCYTGMKCKLLYIELTDSCNFQCIHCYAEIKRSNNDYLTPERFNHILNQIPADYCCDIRLTGGEPFLNKNIKQFILDVEEKITPINGHSIVTNGSFAIDDALFAVAHGFELQISIYGMKCNTFKKFTNASANVWDKVQSNLEILSKSEFRDKVVLCFAVNQLTYKEIDEFIGYANQLGLKYILNRPASTGRAVDNWGELQLSPEDHVAFCKKTKAKQMRFCYHMCQLHLTAICANGDVIPCTFLRKPQYIFGNVFNTELEEIWKSHQYMNFRALNPSMVEKCSKCEFMYACTAGCCAEAEGYDNDILSCYPWCHTKPFKNQYLKISDKEIVEVDKLAAGTFDFRFV